MQVLFFFFFLSHSSITDHFLLHPIRPNSKHAFQTTQRQNFSFQSFHQSRIRRKHGFLTTKKTSQDFHSRKVWIIAFLYIYWWISRVDFFFTPTRKLSTETPLKKTSYKRRLLFEGEEEIALASLTPLKTKRTYSESTLIEKQITGTTTKYFNH